MSKHKRSVARQCEYCGKPFMTYPRGKETGRYCSRSCASLDRAPEINKRAGDKRCKPLVEKVCLQCGKVYYLKPMGQLSAGQKFCSQSCAGRYRFRDPKARSLQAAKIQARIRETGIWAWSGKKNPVAAERMRLKNPMHDPVVKEKARQALLGRTFLSRGGNGQLTSQQEPRLEPPKSTIRHLSYQCSGCSEGQRVTWRSPRQRGKKADIMSL